MGNAVAPIRPAKREMLEIDDDESKSEQPPEKSARMETEPVPSAAEVAELRRKLLESEQKLLESDDRLVKTEQKFQSVCTIADHNKARVQFLENLIDDYNDTKPNIVADAKKDSRIEELEKAVIDLTKQLDDELKGRTGDTTNFRRIEELEKKVDDLTNELKEERKSQVKDRNGLNELPDELENGGIWIPDEIPRVENTGYSTNIIELCDANSCDTEWISFDKARSMLKSSYDKCDVGLFSRRCDDSQPKILNCPLCAMKIEVKKQFIHFFSKGHNKKALSSGQGLSLATVQYFQGKMKEAEVITELRNECHPTNILQLCRSDLLESIPFDRAHDLLLSVFNNYREKNGYNTLRLSRYVRNHAPMFVTCEVCKFSNQMPQALDHIFGKKHAAKARSLGGNVSLAAVNYWIHQLEKADAAVGSGRIKDDAVAATVVAVAAAVAARVESNKTVQIEID